MKTVLLYSSHDGQTIKISNTIAQLLQPGGGCEIKDLHCVTAVDWDQYQKVIVGAAIRYGRLHCDVLSFIMQHQIMLNSKPSAFFCVSLLARKLNRRTPQTHPYLRRFLQRSPWCPKLCAAFAGALRYPRYHWFEQRIIQLIMTITGGETDITKEIEYTDWQQVASFAQQFRELHTA